MTGDPPVLSHPALRAALLDMEIELPGGEPFEETLARRQGWTPGFAKRVTAEYRDFLYLAATAGFEVTPSKAVDEAWHLHLALPHYREILCGRILGRPLEHLPGTGTGEDDARCARQYEETLAYYERVFGEPAPMDIWPRPVGPDPRHTDYTVWPRRRFGLTAAAAGLMAGLAAPGLGAPVLGPVLIVGAIVLGGLYVPFAALDIGRRRDGSAGCGVAGGDSGGSGCCASCGGGCGGGGCGS